MKKIDTAVVLAGGGSKRMNFDKQKIRIGESLIAVFLAEQLQQEFGRVIIISNTKELYSDCNFEVISDRIYSNGPLAGVYTAMDLSEDNYIYFTGCDMPYLNISFVRHMKQKLERTNIEVGGVLAQLNGYYEPLNAFYNIKLKNKIRTQLINGDNKFTKIAEYMNMILISEEEIKEFDPHKFMYKNINSLADFDYLFYFGGIYDVF